MLANPYEGEGNAISDAFRPPAGEVEASDKKAILAHHRHQQHLLTEEKTFSLTTSNGMQWTVSGECLGQGPYSKVVFGQGVDGRQVAIKVKKIAPKLVPVAIAELQHLCKLRHPNVVDLYGCCVEDGQLYLVMEKADFSLADCLEDRKQIPESQMRVYLKSFLRGLQFLHSRNMVHGNIKPESVAIIYSQGIAKLTTATALEAAGTLVGETLLGPPKYMSPETWRGESTSKSDVWSVGIMVWTLVTGSTPFPSQLDYIALQWYVNTVDLATQIPVGVMSPELVDFIRRCLSKDVEARASCDELLKHPFVGGETNSTPDFTSVAEIATNPTSSAAAADVFRVEKILFPALGGEIDVEMKLKRKQCLGEGGFGVVWLYENTTTTTTTSSSSLDGVCVAAKDVPLVHVEAVIRTSIRREVATLKKLSHANIVRYLGFSETPERMSLFMEYCEGGSLSEFISKNGPLKEDILRGYVAQILMGLEYLHKMEPDPIIHRDLKGSNLLLSGDFRTVKLADFGISKELKEQSTRSCGSSSTGRRTGRTTTTSSTSVFGVVATIEFTAPEVFQMKLTPALDIWSLGCVIVEMMTGERPWARNRLENPCSVEFLIIGSGETPQYEPVPAEFQLQDELRNFLQEGCFQRDPRKRASASALRVHPWLCLVVSSVSPLSAPLPLPLPLPPPPPPTTTSLKVDSNEGKTEGDAFTFSFELPKAYCAIAQSQLLTGVSPLPVSLPSDVQRFTCVLHSEVLRVMDAC